MATGSSHIEPVTADDVLTVQFTLIKKGGYDTHEVDAFLDRIVATIDADPSIATDGSLSAADISSVAFERKRRGGYDPAQVDMLLDRVVAAFTTRVGDGLVGADTVMIATEPDLPAASLPEPSVAHPIPEPEPSVAQSIPEPEVPVPAPEPEPVAPRPEVVAPTVVVSESEPLSPSVGTAGAPRLHDPEGAAQKLLAAAQLAADSLAAEADVYSDRVRAEADSYAGATRGEADASAAAVTAAAEAQAAAIREVAADEARRVAEEARTELLDEIAILDGRKQALEADNAALQAELDSERGRILGIIEDLRAAVSGDGPTPRPPADPLPEVADELEAAFADPVTEPEVDPGAVEDAVDEPSGSAPAGEIEPEAAAVIEPEPEAIAPVIEIEPEAAAVIEPEPEAIAPVIELVDQSADADETDSAARSVFDLPAGDATADTSADWLDEPAASPRPGTIFDIEADDGEPTQAMPAVDTGAGDRFFEELRHADPDDALGPVDEDTDAALSAFFDEGDEAPTEGRWRNRFGPGRE